MLKKTITYTDYNGKERIEDFYFHLNQAELFEMEVSTTGGLLEYLNKIVAEQNGAALMKMFKDLILKAYGEKDLDGKHFNKSEVISNKFSQTEAYSVLFMELVTNADAAADFINGMIPADLSKQVEAIKSSDNPELKELNKRIELMRASESDN